MAEVIGLDGVPVEQKSKATSVEACLEGLLEKIEDGLPVEKVLVVAVITDPADPAREKYELFDSGLRVAESVFMLEAAKQAIMQKTFG